MKTTIFPLPRGLFIILFIVIYLASPPLSARAQDGDYPAASGKFSREELAQMLAPVALYPDVLLSQVLMASTYPLEVIEADRWLGRNPGLKDEALDDALIDQSWEPSVKALCHFPSVLALMSDRITETTNLGNAFLAQEGEVMETVQDLRARARAQGYLASTANQNVIVEKETIIIEPADPRVIYVPYYNPYYVYGPWWYPGYPPYYWGPPGVSIGIGISYWPGFYFSFAFGSWCYFDWPHRYLYLDARHQPRYVRHDRWISRPGRWQHLPRHRRGGAYRDRSTAIRYGQSPRRTQDFRRDARGFSDTSDRNRLERDRKAPVRADREKQQRVRIVPDKQQRVTVEQERKVPVQRNQDRRQPLRVPARQKRVGSKTEQQKRIRIEPEQKQRQQVERKEQPKKRENVFDWVEDGKQERQSSERGRSSRQGRDDRHSWGRKGR